MLLELAFMAEMLNECQKDVEPRLLIGLLTNNPYSITVMGTEITPLPNTEGEATAAGNDLDMKGINFNAGMMKIHSSNFHSTGLDNVTAFKACESIEAGAALLAACLPDSNKEPTPMELGKAYACYKAKNFLPAESAPMQLSPSDQNQLINSQLDIPIQDSKPKKVESWDVFEDFTH